MVALFRCVQLLSAFAAVVLDKAVRHVLPSSSLASSGVSGPLTTPCYSHQRGTKGVCSGRLLRGLSLHLSKPSADWMRPFNTKKDISFTQSPWLKMLIQSLNSLWDMERMVSDQIYGHHVLNELTHKIIHTLISFAFPGYVVLSRRTEGK